MREESKTRLSGAAAALITSILLALRQTGRLWTGIFSLQVLCTLLVLSWLPFLRLSGTLSALPNLLLLPLAAVWLALAASPVAYHVVLDLFTGHRVAGAQWYDALWRIYAILALWIAFAALNERVLRPWWREYSARTFGDRQTGSIAAQAHRMRMDERTAKLEAIKKRVSVVLKRKKLAQRAWEVKGKDLERAKENVTELEGMVTRTEERAEKVQGEEREEVGRQTKAVKGMLETAERQVESLEQDLARMDIERDEIDLKMGELQNEWTEALHVNNYTTFYR